MPNRTQDKSGAALALAATNKLYDIAWRKGDVDQVNLYAKQLQSIKLRAQQLLAEHVRTA